ATTWTLEGADQPRRASHPSSVTAEVAFPDGTTRSVTLAGVGCTVSMCSKTVIRGRGKDFSLTTIPLDALARVTDVTKEGALFVMKNGTQQRLSFIPDFRILYFQNEKPGAEKLDLSRIRSLEMQPSAK